MITNYCSKVSSKFVVNCPFNSILFNVQNLKEIASKVARRRNLRTSNFLLSQRNLLKLQLLKKKNAATKRTWAKKVIQRIILAQPRRQIHRRLPRKLQQQRQPQQSNRKWAQEVILLQVQVLMAMKNHQLLKLSQVKLRHYFKALSFWQLFISSWISDCGCWWCCFIKTCSDSCCWSRRTRSW